MDLKDHGWDARLAALFKEIKKYKPNTVEVFPARGDELARKESR
jgi:hypothetical protein